MCFIYSKKEKPSPGDIMKAMIKPGEGGSNPKTGDQVCKMYKKNISV